MSHAHAVAVGEEIVGLIEQTEADGMVVADVPGAFRLGAKSFVALIGGLGDAVVKNIADIGARSEKETGIPAENRDLGVKRAV